MKVFLGNHAQVLFLCNLNLMNTHKCRYQGLCLEKKEIAEINLKMKFLTEQVIYFPVLLHGASCFLIHPVMLQGV